MCALIHIRRETDNEWNLSKCFSKQIWIWIGKERIGVVKKKDFWFIRSSGAHIFGEEIRLMHHPLQTFPSIHSFLVKTFLCNRVVFKRRKRLIRNISGNQNSSSRIDATP